MYHLRRGTLYQQEGQEQGAYMEHTLADLVPRDLRDGFEKHRDAYGLCGLK